MLIRSGLVIYECTAEKLHWDTFYCFNEWSASQALNFDDFFFHNL